MPHGIGPRGLGGRDGGSRAAVPELRPPGFWPFPARRSRAYLITGHYVVTFVMLYNSCTVHYVDGITKTTICNEKVYNPDRDPVVSREKRIGGGGKPPLPPAIARARAIRRAKNRVREISLSNRFCWFVTLTISPETCNRYEFAEIYRKLKNWLDNGVRRKGLVYVLVPERHKDGAIHFHGFFNHALKTKYSGHKDKRGHRIYNIVTKDYPFGFSTAIRLYGEYTAAVAYVCKYISKQGAEGRIGGRYYYSGGKLERPFKSYDNRNGEELYFRLRAANGGTLPQGAFLFEHEASGRAFLIIWRKNGAIMRC